jgi:hypothetical protein
MGNKKRVSMQVAPEFKKRLDTIQKEIMKLKGEKISIRDLTETIAKASDFEYINKFLTNLDTNEFKINLDRRGKK